ncbi:hypothetical protein ACOMHN_049173 [Nucella lapillus]
MSSVSLKQRAFLSFIYPYARWVGRWSQAQIHPEFAASVESTRRLLGGRPDGGVGEEGGHDSSVPTCPVCQGETTYAVETNCGHVYCGQCCCFMVRAVLLFHGQGSVYWQHRDWFGPVPCPSCRTRVTLLMVDFTGREGAEGRGAALTVRQGVHSYNLRFSQELRTVMESLRDVPALLRHAWSDDGFTLRTPFTFCPLQSVVVTLLFLLYLISPFDLVPEAVFGVFGLVDDALAFCLLMLGVTVIYRRVVIARARGINVGGKGVQSGASLPAVRGCRVERLSLQTYQPHLQHKTYQPHLQHKTYQPHLQHKTYQPHLQHKTYQPHLQHKTYQPHLQHKTYQPHLQHKTCTNLTFNTRRTNLTFNTRLLHTFPVRTNLTFNTRLLHTFPVRTNLTFNIRRTNLTFNTRRTNLTFNTRRTNLTFNTRRTNLTFNTRRTNLTFNTRRTNLTFNTRLLHTSQYAPHASTNLTFNTRLLHTFPVRTSRLDQPHLQHKTVAHLPSTHLTPRPTSPSTQDCCTPSQYAPHASTNLTFNTRLLHTFTPRPTSPSTQDCCTPSQYTPTFNTRLLHTSQYAPHASTNLTFNTRLLHTFTP